MNVSLRNICIFGICTLAAVNSFAQPNHNEQTYLAAMIAACEDRNIQILDEFLTKEYSPFLRRNRISAFEAALKSRFFEGIEHMILSAPPYENLDRHAKNQVIGAIDKLSRGPDSKAQVARVKQILEYFHSMSALSGSELESLVATMDYCGKESKTDLLVLFLKFGLRPASISQYRLTHFNFSSIGFHENPLSLRGDDVEGLFRAYRTWEWIVSEVEERRVSRWYFPGTVVAIDSNARESTNDFAGVADLALLPFQTVTSVIGAVKLIEPRRARFQAQLFAFSLIEKGYVDAPIELPRSVGPVGNYLGVRSYDYPALKLKFQKYLQALSDRVHRTITSEQMVEAVFSVGMQMGELKQFFEAEAFDEAVLEALHL